LQQVNTKFPTRKSTAEPFWELGVEATPKEFILMWQGEEFARVPHPMSNDSLDAMRKFLRVPADSVIDPPPRGGLGVFVCGGSASFRLARVSPLQP
jgi:hypothetical protein